MINPNLNQVLIFQKPQRKKKKKTEPLLLRGPDHKKYLEYIGLGVEIAVAFTLPMLIGFWADSRYDSSPWFLISGILLGMILMIAIFLRVIRNMNKPE
jgi:F0F1-type ATP synthase assembly protein I